MKKSIIVSSLLLCGALAVGCGKKEEKKIEIAKPTTTVTQTPTKAVEQIPPIVIGQKEENSIEVQLKNCTGFEITGLVLKNIKEKEFSPNLLLNNQKIKNNQIAQIFYTPRKENIEETDSDKAIMPIYMAEITLSNGKTFTLFSIGVNDIKDIAKVYYDPEDDIGFLVYVSKKTNSSISTKEMEKGAKKAGGVKVGSKETATPSAQQNNNESNNGSQQDYYQEGNNGSDQGENQNQSETQEQTYLENQGNQDQGNQDQEDQDQSNEEDCEGCLEQPVINQP